MPIKQRGCGEGIPGILRPRSWSPGTVVGTQAYSVATGGFPAVQHLPRSGYQAVHGLVVLETQALSDLVALGLGFKVLHPTFDLTLLTTMAWRLYCSVESCICNHIAHFQGGPTVEFSG